VVGQRPAAEGVVEHGAALRGGVAGGGQHRLGGVNAVTEVDRDPTHQRREPLLLELGGLPFGDFALSLLGVTLAVLALQSIGLARSVVLIRRWRTHPARRPRPVIGAVRILLPLLANLTLLWAVLNQDAGPTTDSVLLFMQFGGDIGWALLISATIALGWGVILRPTLTILALRSRPPITPMTNRAGTLQKLDLTPSS
jgi:hypothetical protein